MITGSKSEPTAIVKQLFYAGILAAEPDLAVLSCLKMHESVLSIALDADLQRTKDFANLNQIHLLAFGKAACAMAEAATGVIPASLLRQAGLVVTNKDNFRVLANMEVIAAGHPYPDQASEQAAKRIIRRIQSARADELVLLLISGGGSALVAAPNPAICLEDKILCTQLLLASGASINEVNTVRKHLSLLKGGRLAKLAVHTQLHALILSDVIDDDVSAIASGPTVADSSCFSDAISILQQRNIWAQVPERVRNLLSSGESGLVAETPKPDDSCFNHTAYTLVGSNALSVDAVMQSADKAGIATRLYSKNLAGEARLAAACLARELQQYLQLGMDKDTVWIAGGETTVTLKGNGRGGRNQEFALAFALAAEDLAMPAVWTLLCGGTDGRDGPTDAAGGVVDSNTLGRIRAQGLNPQALLDNNDAYTALAAADALLLTGATGTNVADLLILLLTP